MEKEKTITKLEILKKLSSGTGLREALNDIVSGEMGALIVVSNSNSNNIFKGGFYVNCKFTSKRLTELAKMDGAIILSEDFKKNESEIGKELVEANNSIWEQQKEENKS